MGNCYCNCRRCAPLSPRFATTAQQNQSTCYFDKEIIMARKPNAAFMKALTPSPALAAVVGNKPLPRTEITKKLWAYIKKNKLQDAKNKRNINADATLQAIFGGKKTVNMFEMTKLVSKHLK
jgi:upstream activation factor subunit UAF30